MLVRPPRGDSEFCGGRQDLCVHLVDVWKTECAVGFGKGGAVMSKKVKGKAAVEALGIPVSEYLARREAVLAALGGAAAVVHAGDGGAPLKGRWTPDRNFLWLTGIDDEPGAAVLFDPSAEDPNKRIVLLLKPVNPEMDRWDGYRDLIGTPLKARTGFSSIVRTGSLPALLTGAARRTKRLACLHPFAVYPAPVSADLAAFRSVAERVPGVAIEDRTQVLPSLRAAKSENELALMRRAVEATTAGYYAALGMLRPGVTEAQVQDAMEDAYRAAGARDVAYNSIVGAGINGTVLHYMANSALVKDGDVLVIDSGASYDGYASDVTRTFPASGKFSPKQKKIYEIVLRSLDAGIAAARAGITNGEVDRVCRAVIEEAGYGDAFIHGAGHPLGLDVHELGPDGPLVPGMVITIEPGIYLPDEGFGVRIEDDLLILDGGNENLTGHIPRTVREIEKAMAG
jgi:Xaa-Pro aminopeptidase